MIKGLSFGINIIKIGSEIKEKLKKKTSGVLVHFYKKNSKLIHFFH